MDDDARFRDLARRLGAAVEPLAAALYFSPQAQARYETLGLNYFEGYFCSRSAPLGALPWRGVAAGFAAFPPGVVERAVTGGGGPSPPRGPRGGWTPGAAPCSPAGRACRCPTATTRSSACGGPPTWSASSGATGTSAPG